MDHAAMAGTVACSTPTSDVSSPVQRHGMITQNGPDGSDVMPGSQLVDEAQSGADFQSVRQIPRRKRNHRWLALP